MAQPRLPEALIASLEARPPGGFDEPAFLAAHALPPPVSIRLNPLKPGCAFPSNDPVPWSQYGYYLPERPQFTLDPAFHAGAYYVQEASSQFLDHAFRELFPDSPSLRILDLCAAPGGKSTLLAAAMSPDSLLVSNEVIKPRAALLEENAVRWGYPNHWVTSNDPRDFAALKGYFDLVVVDAPCSGSGLFRKDPDAVAEWSPANVKLCAERQQRILADCWDCLKASGILIYATCSYSIEEDEAILDHLAEAHEVEAVKLNLPADWNIVEVGSGLTGYRFYPDKLRGEGFFMAVIRKTEQTTELQFPKSTYRPQKTGLPPLADLLTPGDWLPVPGKEEWFALPAGRLRDFELLNARLYLKSCGVSLGQFAGRDWVPAHGLALSTAALAALTGVELTRDEALLFLKKEPPQIPPPPKGWYLARYQGLNLGWMKSLGNRINNYLPKSWRIRMQIPV